MVKVTGSFFFYCGYRSSYSFYFNNGFFLIKKTFIWTPLDYIQIIFALLFFAIYFYFNFEKKKRFKREKIIAPFKYGKWKPLPELEYVALFAVNPGTFEINL